MMQTQESDPSRRDKYQRKFDWTREQKPPNSNGIYGIFYPKIPKKEKDPDFGNLRYKGPPSWYLKDDFMNAKLANSEDCAKTLKKLQAYQDSDGTWRFPWQQVDRNYELSREERLAYKPMKRSVLKRFQTTSVPQYEQNLNLSYSSRMRGQITATPPRPSELLSTNKKVFTGINNQGVLFQQFREPFSSRMEPMIEERHHYFYDKPKTVRTHFDFYPGLNGIICQVEQ